MNTAKSDWQRSINIATADLEQTFFREQQAQLQPNKVLIKTTHSILALPVLHGEGASTP